MVVRRSFSEGGKPRPTTSSTITLGSGKRLLPTGLHQTFSLTAATPYPSGVVRLHYARQQGTA